MTTVPFSGARLSSGRTLAVVSISHLARRTGVTVRALRHYEALGLLEPVRTRTGERRFPPEQCERASRIALLRRCDVALGDIRDILDAPVERGRERIRQVLEARAATLDEQLRTIQAALTAADQPLDLLPSSCAA